MDIQFRNKRRVGCRGTRPGPQPSSPSVLQENVKIPDRLDLNILHCPNTGPTELSGVLDKIRTKSGQSVLNAPFTRMPVSLYKSDRADPQIPLPVTPSLSRCISHVTVDNSEALPKLTNLKHVQEYWSNPGLSEKSNVYADIRAKSGGHGSNELLAPPPSRCGSKMSTSGYLPDLSNLHKLHPYWSTPEISVTHENRAQQGRVAVRFPYPAPSSKAVRASTPVRPLSPCSSRARILHYLSRPDHCVVDAKTGFIYKAHRPISQESSSPTGEKKILEEKSRCWSSFTNVREGLSESSYDSQSGTKQTKRLARILKVQDWIKKYRHIFFDRDYADCQIEYLSSH